MVVDALSRVTIGSLSYVEQEKKELVKDVHRLAQLGVRFEDSPHGGFIVHHNSDSSLVVEVKSKQHLDPLLMELNELILSKSSISHSSKGGWCS